MEKDLFHLCLAVTFAWLCFFLYLLIIDSRLKRLKRRLDARSKD